MASAGGEWRRSWWIALAAVPFGWLAFVAFAYAGKRARRRDWLAWAAVYGVVFWTATVVASIEELDYAVRQAGGVVMFFGTPVPIAHALVIRRAYLDATAAAPAAPPVSAPPAQAPSPDAGDRPPPRSSVRWRGAPSFMLVVGILGVVAGAGSVSAGEPFGISMGSMGLSLVIVASLRASLRVDATPVVEPVGGSGKSGLVFRYSANRALLRGLATVLFMVAAAGIVLWPDALSPRRARFARPVGIAAVVAAAATLGSGATGRAGGVVALTAGGIRNESGSFRTAVSWELVRDVRPGTWYDGGPVVAVDAADSRAVESSPVARAARFLGGFSRRRTGHVTLDPRALDVDPRALLGIVRHYWQHADDRAELGTAAAADRFENVRAALAKEPG